MSKGTAPGVNFPSPGPSPLDVLRGPCDHRIQFPAEPQRLDRGGWVEFGHCVDCGRGLNYRVLLQRPATLLERQTGVAPLGWEPPHEFQGYRIIPELTYPSWLRTASRGRDSIAGAIPQEGST